MIDELSADDRVRLLMVIGQIQAVLAMALHRYLDLFDPELAAAYARDSRLDLKGADKG